MLVDYEGQATAKAKCRDSYPSTSVGVRMTTKVDTAELGETKARVMAKTKGYGDGKDTEQVPLNRAPILQKIKGFRGVSE